MKDHMEHYNVFYEFWKAEKELFEAKRAASKAENVLRMCEAHEKSAELTLERAKEICKDFLSQFKED